MKIYDCFTFYNELDLLELRLHELYDHVDHFVLVEANSTFTNRDKPFNFELNRDRYAKYLDKIIYVQVTDMPKSTNAWDNETFQRNAILRGLVDADANDIALVGDVDEILRPETVDQVRADNKEVMGFRIPYFNFKYNYILVNNWESYHIWNVGCRVGMLQDPNGFRGTRFNLNSFPFDYQDDNIKIYEHAGWHFTYLGDNSTIKDKISNFSHTELNTDSVLSRIDVDGAIAKGVGFNPDDDRPFTPVALDDYFPKTIRDNIDQYKDRVIMGITKSARELFS